MDCEDVGEILEAFHAGEASLDEYEGLEEHLASCEGCRQALQKILYDVDLAAYTTFFEDMKPPPRFARKVMESLPGGKGEGGKRGSSSKGGGSSSRLATVRGEKKTGARRGRPSSSGMLRAHRKTGVRRKDPSREPSGVFLQDQIFGAQEKKTGLIITYCEECGERIDPSLFESGEAVRYKNASYCPKCKSAVEGLLEEEAPSPKRKGRSRAKAGTRGPARPPSTRVATPPRTKKPMNLPLVGGGLVGAAVLILVIGVVAFSMMGDGDDGRVIEPEGSDDTGAPEDADLSPQKDLEPASPPSSEDSVKKEMQQRKALAQKRKKDEEERARLARIPGEKVAQYREKARLLEEEEKFQEALNLWNRWIANATEGEIEDPKTGKKLKFKEEHIREMQVEREGLKERWERWKDQLIGKAKEAVRALADAEKFKEALVKLDEYVEKYRSDYPDRVQELEYLKGRIQLMAQRAAEAKARKIIAENRRAIEAGSWVEMMKSKNDILANWGAKGKVQWIDDEDPPVLRLDGNGTNIFSGGFSNASKWFDYELSFEMKSSVACIVYMRYDAQSRSYAVTVVPECAGWTKVHVKIEQLTLYLEVGDKQAQPKVLDKPGTGGVVFRPYDAGHVQIRDLKIKVNVLR